MKSKFSVSLMCMDFLDMRNQLEIINKRADGYHVDIMDGHFCKNITLSPDFVKRCKQVAKLPIDVHLMTQYPTDWLDMVADAGATTISPHAETINTDAFRVLNKIKELGCRAGVTLNPATPIDYIKHYLSRLDMLTIMTVDVGYAGQPFIPEMLEKIAEAKMLRQKHGYNYEIQVDGACNADTYKRLHEAGADIYVMGSTGLFNLDKDLNTAYDKMEEQFSEKISK